MIRYIRQTRMSHLRCSFALTLFGFKFYVEKNACHSTHLTHSNTIVQYTKLQSIKLHDMSDNQVSFNDGLDARLSTINILNNNGAACIKNAHFDHAFNTLKEALVCLKRTGEDVKSQQQLIGGSKKSSSVTVLFLDNDMPTAMWLASSSTTRFTSSSLHTDEDGGFVSQDPVRIRSWEDSDYETIFDQLTLTVYYNLAGRPSSTVACRYLPGNEHASQSTSNF
jgi:hypothetical protein